MHRTAPYRPMSAHALPPDGKLDSYKVGDFLGGGEEVQRRALKHVLESLQLQVPHQPAPEAR